MTTSDSDKRNNVQLKLKPNVLFAKRPAISRRTAGMNREIIKDYREVIAKAEVKVTPEVNHRTTSESWTAQVCNLKINQVFESKNNNEINFFLVSGCTDHIINNDTYFYNYIDLKIPVDVKLPAGNILKATKVYLLAKFISNPIMIKNM